MMSTEVLHLRFQCLFDSNQVEQVPMVKNNHDINVALRIRHSKIFSGPVLPFLTPKPIPDKLGQEFPFVTVMRKVPHFSRNVMSICSCFCSNPISSFLGLKMATLPCLSCDI